MKQKQIGSETFAESVEGYKVPDIGFYIATGVNAMERAEKWRATYRLHLSPDLSAVHWELRATFCARVVLWHIDESGQKTATFGARGQDGSPFTFRLRERDFQNTKAIGRAIYAASGAHGFIVPGCARSFMRAVLKLSEQMEPMPYDVDAMRAHHRAEFDEVDPFDDDFHDPWNHPSDYGN